MLVPSNPLYQTPRALARSRCVSKQLNMASPDPPAQKCPKRLDWGADFSFARKPTRDAPFSPGTPSPRTAPPHSRPADARQDAIVKEESRAPSGVAARVMLPPLPSSPLSPVCGPGRLRQGSLVIDVSRAGLPYSLPPIQPCLPTPETACTTASGPGAHSDARSVLQSEAARLGKPLDRRESAHVTGEPWSASTIHSEILQLREHLKFLGPVYLGNIAPADALVQAVALRRSSLPDSSASSSSVKDEPKEKDGVDHSAKPLHTPDSPKFGNDISVRARVRPRQADRRPFVIHRKFNLDELRATIPDLGARLDSGSTFRRSSVADLALPYTGNSKVPEPPPTPLIGRARRRSTSAKHGPVTFSLRGRRTPGGAGAEVKVDPRASSNLMPMRKCTLLPTTT